MKLVSCGCKFHLTDDGAGFVAVTDRNGNPAIVCGGIMKALSTAGELNHNFTEPPVTDVPSRRKEGKILTWKSESANCPAVKFLWFLRVFHCWKNGWAISASALNGTENVKSEPLLLCDSNKEGNPSEEIHIKYPLGENRVILSSPCDFKTSSSRTLFGTILFVLYKIVTTPLIEARGIFRGSFFVILAFASLISCSSLRASAKASHISAMIPTMTTY